MGTHFRILCTDSQTSARRGLLITPHGSVQTPVFMPVGTAASVKAVPQEFLEQLNARLLLANAYHLHLRPGHETIRRLGGLHGFMSWNRPILTDSGGFQVFSHRGLSRVGEEGVEFQSYLDGSRHFLSPEKSIEIQQALGADVIMAFDDCTRYPVAESEARDSMLRSLRWARRCRRKHESERQALFGIVQGSVFSNLRRESLEEIGEMGFSGIALGGFSVGEPKWMMRRLIERLGPLLPETQPRYLMGVGTPLDLLFCVKQGLDMFDCVLPTRNARNGTLFTSVGKVRIKNSRYKDDPRPLDPNCGCRVCGRYSRAYLRHLFVRGEILASLLNSYHNLYFYLDLMEKVRESITRNALLDLEKRLVGTYTETS
ncbi:MAG: tRNA guanosine(34) transglycosylase Tgt [Acidobacteriota bacterium]